MTQSQSYHLESETRSDQDGFLDQVAKVVCRYGLRLPALIALEAGRPLLFVGGQLLWIGQPLLGLFMPKGVIGQAAQLLEEPASVEALIARLEGHEA